MLLLQPGHQDESELPRVGDVGQASEELHGGRFVEGVGQAPPEDDPDGAGATAAQAAGDGIGPAVAEFGRRAQDAFAQGGREPFRPVERVGHRARGHADGTRDGHDPGLARDAGLALVAVDRHADRRCRPRRRSNRPERRHLRSGIKRCKARSEPVKRCKRRVSQIHSPATKARATVMGHGLQREAVARGIRLRSAGRERGREVTS